MHTECEGVCVTTPLSSFWLAGYQWETFIGILLENVSDDFARTILTYRTSMTLHFTLRPVDLSPFVSEICGGSRNFQLDYLVIVWLDRFEILPVEASEQCPRPVCRSRR
jgi:hypothetical protein